MFFPAVLLTVSTLFFIPVSTSPLQRRQAAATVISSCTVPKTAAITFDDGPYLHTKTLSDLFISAGAKATFFVNGNNFGCIYADESIDSVRYAFNAGHQIASHTWSHPDIANLTTTQIHDTMYRTEEALSRILGVRPAFTRPPYGSFNDAAKTVFAARNQIMALWDRDTGDADGNTTAQAEAVYQDAVNGKASSNGYKLVTLAECVGVQPYSIIGVPQTQDASWTCVDTPGPGEGCVGTQCKSGIPPVLPALPSSSSSAPPSSTPPPSSSTPPPSSTPPTSPSSSPPPHPVQTGLVIRASASSTKCLTVASNSDAAAVSIKDCDGSASQGWTLSGSTITIFGNKCLDVPSGSTANGVKMQVYTCSAGNPNQQWTVSSGGVGTGTIQWKGKTECLDNSGGVLTNGNPTQMWQCSSGNANQRWVIASPSTTTPPPPPPPPTTGKAIHPKLSATTCLTASSDADGASVVVRPCTSASNQQWVKSGNTFKIFSNKCLDVPSGSTADGVKMQIWTCSTANPNQSFTTTATSTIQWTGKGKCLDLTDGSLANGNAVQTWACSANNPNQAWNIV